MSTLAEMCLFLFGFPTMFMILVWLGALSYLELFLILFGPPAMIVIFVLLKAYSYQQVIRRTVDGAICYLHPTPACLSRGQMYAEMYAARSREASTTTWWNPRVDAPALLPTPCSLASADEWVRMNASDPTLGVCSAWPGTFSDFVCPPAITTTILSPSIGQYAGEFVCPKLAHDSGDLFSFSDNATVVYPTTITTTVDSAQVSLPSDQHPHSIPRSSSIQSAIWVCRTTLLQSPISLSLSPSFLVCRRSSPPPPTPAATFS